MSKFDPREHKRRQTHEALLALHHEDGYTYEFLAELCCCPIGTFRAFVPQDYHSSKVPPSDVLDLLRYRLAKEWKNYRLCFKDLPDTDTIVHAESAAVANGLDDELQDGAKALGLLATSIQAGDFEQAAKVAEEFDRLSTRTRHEAHVLKAKKERVQADGVAVGVTMYGDGK